MEIICPEMDRPASDARKTASAVMSAGSTKCLMDEILFSDLGHARLSAMAFYSSTGKKVIRINKEVKGHIANRLQVAIWQEAISLVQRGVVSVEDIDAAISYGPGLRWALLGPFLNHHASGGPGGIAHVLRHLGPAQREWAKDLDTYPETDDYVASIAKGVDIELQSYDFPEMLRQRDQLLIQLLETKRNFSQIP
jgi:carnitine 3-dehydrogenase